MTSAVHNARNSINEAIANHSAVNILFEFGDVIPPANIVALERFHPIEHTSNPFQFLVLLAGANGIGCLTEVNVRVSTVSSLVMSALSKIIIQLAEIADSCRLDYTPSPEAAAFDIRTARRIREGRRIVESTRLLALVVIAILGRIVPRHVTLFGVIPDASERVLRLWSTVERSRSAPPFGICGRRDLHVRLYLTFHMSLTFGTLVILVGLTELTTGVCDGIFAIHQVPRVLVACIVLNGLLHRLSQESRDIDEPVEMTIGTVVAHEEVFVCHTIVVHYT